MSRTVRLCSLAGLIAAATCPSLALAQPTSNTEQVRNLMTAIPIGDVSLAEDGVLRGVITTSQMDPVNKTKVLVRHQGRLVAAASTGENGQFHVSGLRGGVYSVEAATGSVVFRLWAPGTAPPGARPNVHLVLGNETIVRGQEPAVWVEETELINRCHIQGAVWGGVITGLTYWALDYNQSGS